MKSCCWGIYMHAESPPSIPLPVIFETSQHRTDHLKHSQESEGIKSLAHQLFKSITLESVQSHRQTRFLKVTSPNLTPSNNNGLDTPSHWLTLLDRDSSCWCPSLQGGSSQDYMSPSIINTTFYRNFTPLSSHPGNSKLQKHHLLRRRSWRRWSLLLLVVSFVLFWLSRGKLALYLRVLTE
jgi:hypothetical protein